MHGDYYQSVGSTALLLDTLISVAPSTQMTACVLPQMELKSLSKPCSVNMCS